MKLSPETLWCLFIVTAFVVLCVHTSRNPPAHIH